MGVLNNFSKWGHITGLLEYEYFYKPVKCIFKRNYKNTTTRRLILAKIKKRRVSASFYFLTGIS